MPTLTREAEEVSSIAVFFPALKHILLSMSLHCTNKWVKRWQHLHAGSVGHKDREGKTAASEAPADVAALLRPGEPQGWMSLPRPLATWRSAEQTASGSKASPSADTGASSQSAEAAPSFWARLAWLGSPQVAPAANDGAQQSAPAMVRPSDVLQQGHRAREGTAAATATPSAPPLPRAFHGGLYSSDPDSSAQDLQPLMSYPSLHLAHSAQATSGTLLVPPPTQWLSTDPTVSATANPQPRSEPMGDTGAAGEREEASGAVAWALQTATAASGAALSALLGALPWPGKGGESAQAATEDPAQAPPADEQRRQSGR